MGNTLIVVEHDEETMYEADHIIDIGPGAGIHGGEVVAEGNVEEIKACRESITGSYLRGERQIPVPAARRSGNGQSLKIAGASENNLKGIDVTIPLGQFICVTGVSGSGKSSLINEVLYKNIAAFMHHSKERPGLCKEINGIEKLIKSST